MYLRPNLSFLWLSLSALRCRWFVENPDFQLTYTAFNYPAFLFVRFYQK